MDQLKTVTTSVGHGSVQESRQESSIWKDAHSSGGELRNEIQAQILEARILDLIAQNPEAAAESPIGKMHLAKYWWMLGKEDIKKYYQSDIDEWLKQRPGEDKEEWSKRQDKYLHMMKEWDYPYKFEIGDVLLESKEILIQLVCDEYFMNGKESSPYTPEAFSQNLVTWRDPFDTFERPRVTVEAKIGDKTETFSFNGPEFNKPKHGFLPVC